MRKWWVTSGVVVLVIAASLYFLYVQMTGTEQSTLSLKNQTYQLTIARTEADREQGLSDTESLPADHAMLFVFPTISKPGIWMKDMNYPIDIVWLDTDKKVVYTVVGAQPSSYPKIFQTDKDSRYVIELPAGTIEKTGIHRGDKADFDVTN
ncbi:MAG: hypothetical protein JWN75_320 [Candidatus Saccharibacteria bacterium]|nr:hypothetical protein [Candidatus Saccharibacteria bacterium]